MFICFHGLAAEIGFQGNPWSPTRWQELTVLHQSCGLKESRGNESISPIACIWIISNLDRTSETQLALLNNLGKWIRFCPQECSFKKKRSLSILTKSTRRTFVFTRCCFFACNVCIVAAESGLAALQQLAGIRGLQFNKLAVSISSTQAHLDMMGMMITRTDTAAGAAGLREWRNPLLL